MKQFDSADWLSIQRESTVDPSNTASLRSIIDYIISERNIDSKISKLSKYFRARTIKEDDKNKVNYNRNGTGFYGFNEKDSSAPPQGKAFSGRANRKGESVLYLAEDIYTALAEVKPGKRQNISIAEFEILEDLKIASLCFSEDPELSKEIYYWMAFSFFIPVNDVKCEYYITQEIAQYLKESGYDGIEYSSSLSASGRNLVIFDPGKAKPLNSKIYHTMALLYYAEEQLPRENNERILPKSITDRFKDYEIDWFLSQFKDG